MCLIASGISRYAPYILFHFTRSYPPSTIFLTFRKSWGYLFNDDPRMSSISYSNLTSLIVYLYRSGRESRICHPPPGRAVPSLRRHSRRDGRDFTRTWETGTPLLNTPSIQRLTLLSLQVLGALLNLRSVLSLPLSPSIHPP